MTKLWYGLDYLFIDEVSMVSFGSLRMLSLMLSWPSDCLSMIDERNIIVAGDVAQLPPLTIAGNHYVGHRPNHNIIDDKFYQIYTERVKGVIHSEEPIDERFTCLSINNSTSNKEGSKTDSDDDRLRPFAIVPPVDGGLENNVASSTSSVSSSTALASRVKQAKTSEKNAGKKRDTEYTNVD
ncbi:hypothetical protein F5887DRAFT_1081411 [Amanita rubescens]|nr:hypothetical protein F5887DRAFT_1082625 [Amanita rubescens]KAF8330972.1 hypothetical protein F5887DRAFT_1081411 [Amanita rubescens]